MTAVGGTCRSPAFRASDRCTAEPAAWGDPEAVHALNKSYVQRHWRQSPGLHEAAPPAARTSAQVLADGGDILGDSLICRTLQKRESLRGVFVVFRIEPVAGPGVRERD
jgi:hypothetical protein